MNSLSKIIERYAAFEVEVSAYTTKIFHRRCSACDVACCRPEICEESLTSPFLKRLRQRFVPDAAYRDDSGWLKPSGCALPLGRPPVCYQFFCDDIFENRQQLNFAMLLPFSPASSIMSAKKPLAADISLNCRIFPN